MILVDSSVWIDYFNGQPTEAANFLDRSLGVENLVIGDIILTEVLQGFKRDKDFDTAKNLLTSFEVHPIVNQELAIKSADNFRLLRKRGVRNGCRLPGRMTIPLHRCPCYNNKGWPPFQCKPYRISRPGSCPAMTSVW